MTESPTTLTRWPHSPPHWFVENGNYFITASTYQKLRLFNSPMKLEYLQSCFFAEAMALEWELQAWAFMGNHYHVIMRAPEDARSLSRLIQAVHSKTAEWLNVQDGAPGRRVWFQYRDTCLTYKHSYFARLHYVMRNPERHKLVANAEAYRWCSMQWFKQNAEEVFRTTVLKYGIERVSVPDDFD